VSLEMPLRRQSI